MKNQLVRNNIRSVVARRRLITSWRDFVLLVIGACITLMLVGCAEIELFGSKIQTFRGKDSMLLPVSRPDILDIVAEVGKSMGYSVSALDREANTISLSSSSSMLSTALIGKTSQAMLTISSKDNGKRLDINVIVTGNFGTGGQEAAMKIIDDFKTKLLERIGP